MRFVAILGYQNTVQEFLQIDSRHESLFGEVRHCFYGRHGTLIKLRCPPRRA